MTDKIILPTHEEINKGDKIDIWKDLKNYEVIEDAEVLSIVSVARNLLKVKYTIPDKSNYFKPNETKEIIEVININRVCYG